MHNGFNYQTPPTFVMTEPNETIILHDGVFTLRFNELQIEVQGVITFTWFPSVGNRFKGNVKNNTTEVRQSLFADHNYELYIGNDKIGDCFIVYRNTSFNSSDLVIKGIMIYEAVTGDRTISVKRIKFVIPNLRWFNGKPIVADKSGIGYNGRLLFETDDYNFVVDQFPNHRELTNKLNDENGGYVFLCSGELICKSGILSYKSSQEVFHCFSIFLGFLNGRRTSPMMRQGVFDEKEVWSDFLPYNVDIYKPVQSWPSKTTIVGLNELWIEFYQLWKRGHKSFLIAAVHWYIEANANSGFTEGSIIMAQTNLELLYNWTLIENRKLLMGRDAENISASNKLRLLLSFLNLSNEVPLTLKHLKAFVDASKKTIPDAPEAFVQVRNAIVHSNANKREKLNDTDPIVKREALTLAIWYIELALLRIFKFRGKYYNRCANQEEEVAFHSIY